MLETNYFDEDEIIDRITIKECIQKFDPEIQTIFYNAYGKDLEAIQKELLQVVPHAEDLLEKLLDHGNVRTQKIILMRLGIVTGTPMTLDEVANEFGITKERVRQIENMVFRKRRPLIRSKKISDFYSDK